jgi:hypothetical protein
MEWIDAPDGLGKLTKVGASDRAEYCKIGLQNRSAATTSSDTSLRNVVAGMLLLHRSVPGGLMPRMVWES